MEKNSMLKRSLVVATMIVALGASTAFAAYHKNMQNNTNMHMNKTTYMSSNKQMLMHHNNYKTSPTMTLSKLSNMPMKTIIEECKMDYLDSYQYARKHGFLNKYKVERMMIAKENVNRAVSSGRLDSMKSKKVLAKINSNIAKEKPEMTAVYCKMKPMKKTHTKNMKNMKNMQSMQEKNEGRYYDFKYHDNFGANVMNMDE